jgi:FKBP-type peptidyl-prolyl cis-trans isomerase 2
VGTLNDGTIVTDSLKENGNEQKLITLGASMTYKCLELALQQLHQGDHAIVKCPSHLVFGSKPQTSPLT